MSASRNPSLAELARPAPRPVMRALATCALALVALALHATASAANPPVHTPPEVRTAPTQFIVVAVANPVSGRPAAVGGTAHGYGGASNYRVGATAAAHGRA